ncbi:hypothetical protein, partial [Citrobacter amalonaticus]
MSDAIARWISSRCNDSGHEKAPLKYWTAPQKLDTQLSKVQFFMAKPKYSPETKLAVVNHYLSGKDG